MRASGFLLSCYNKTTIRVDVDALNVVVMAKEESLAGFLLVEQLLVEHHTHRSRVVDNLCHVPTNVKSRSLVIEALHIGQQ